ncbi:MAG: hypothetical protein V4553_10030 [Bacteroidota bacterium]
MKVLCLLDINDYRNRNSFPIDFVNSFKGFEQVAAIEYGIKQLLADVPRWDIIHIHWPEDLMKGKILSQDTIDKLNEKLKTWRKHARIICTVHDHESYYRNSKLITALYNCVFTNCDGFIHMGEASVEIFNKAFKNRYASIPFAIIPHGNYSSMGKLSNKARAREELNIKPDAKVILVIGKLRHKEEISLMLNSFKTIKTQGFQLFFLGSFQTTRSFIKDLNFKAFFKSLFEKMQRRLLFYNAKNVFTKIGANDNSVVAKYLSAADVLFIPRKKILNSGNVPLGFTFAKVVVGPAWGNVGEILTRYNNQTFQINDTFDQIGVALVNSMALVNTDLGEKNKEMALSTWDWKRIAHLHIDFYISLIGFKTTD